MRGKLQQADGGTLFLDEIGDMPLALQTRLFMRVLEDRLVVPIGGEPQAVNVRVISATTVICCSVCRPAAFVKICTTDSMASKSGLPPLRERSDKPQLLDFLLAQEAGSRDDNARCRRASGIAGVRLAGQCAAVAHGVAYPDCTV